MSYRRVVPRDFFNEAKLLKCLGRLQLMILNKEVCLKSDFDGEHFDIAQADHDGSISCLNYHVFHDDDLVILYTPLNSKERWPLMAELNGETYYVFDEAGKLMPDWKN